MPAKRLFERGLQQQLQRGNFGLVGAKDQIAGRKKRTRVLQANAFRHGVEIGHDHTSPLAQDDSVEERDIGLPQVNR